MFNNLKKSNNGRIRAKLLATMLVITLTFANFALLSSHMLKSIAAGIDVENQTEDTSISNVKFSVYFDRVTKQKQIEKDINTEDLTLFVEVNVKNGGYLQSGTIEFEDCNFRLKDNTELSKLEISAIQAGKGIVKEISIIPAKDNSFDLSLLNKPSKIKLTGTYINNEGEEQQLNEEKYVQICWDAQNSTENDIKLEQKVITNKTYQIDGENKQVVQLLINSGLQNNTYPIKNTTIQVAIPELEEGVSPENVVVASYNTTATNGKNSVEFGTQEEQKLGQWSYNEENKTVNIVVENKSENNIVSWVKNAQDQFVVTYVYDESVNLTNFKSVVNSQIALYEKNNTVLNCTSTIEGMMAEELKDIITLDKTGTELLYKSNMNIGKETEFNVNWTLNVGYSGIDDAIGMALLDTEKLVMNDDTAVDAETYYKSTIINKEEFLKIFGEDGQLAISYGVSEEDFLIVNKDTIGEDAPEDDNIMVEGNNIIITYKEGVSQILMSSITKTQSEGKLNIVHNKVLNTSSLESEQIKEIKQLETNVQLIVEQNENSIIEDSYSENLIIPIEAPKTEVVLGIDNKSLSTTHDNIMNITATLKADSLKYDLHVNPQLVIEFPEEVTAVEVPEGAISVINQNEGNELQIDTNNIGVNTNSNGKQEITIKLLGEQNQYLGQDTQVLINNVKVKSTKLTPTIENEIVFKCVNGKETTYSNGLEYAISTQKVTFYAEQGVLLANGISNYNSNQPEIVVFNNEETITGLLNDASETETIATVTATIINNTDSDLENVIINPKLEQAEELGVEIISEELTIERIEKGTKQQFTYQIKIPANIGTNKEMQTYYTMEAGANTYESPKIRLETQREAKLELTVTPNVENGATINEGALLTYDITVKNTGETAVRNIKISNPVPEGTTLLETAQTEWIIEELEAGQSQTKTAQFTVNSLDEGENSKTIQNNVTVEADYLQQALTNTLICNVEKAKVEGSIIDGYQDGYRVYENGQIFYVTTIRNISEIDLTNLEITTTMPDNTTHRYDEAKILNNEIIGTKQDNKIVYKIDKLEKGKSVVLKITLNAGTLQENQYEQAITYKVELKSNQIEKYEIQKVDKIIKPHLTMEYVSENITSSERDRIVKQGDVLEYVSKIKNEGVTSQSIIIKGEFSSATSCEKLSYKVEENEEVEVEFNGYKYEYIVLLEPQQTLTMTMKAKVEDVISTEEDILINNELYCAAIIVNRDGMGTLKYVNELQENIQYIIEKIETEPEEPDKPEDPDNPEDPDKPDDPVHPEKQTYKISGIAWLDENENGEQEGSEKLLKGILVKIKNVQTQEYLKNEKGEDLTAITDKDGKYEFKELEAGKYTVEYEYNKNTYKLTPVTGKSSVANTVTINDQTIITTDTITITNKDVSNINIGLCLNPEYDLKLEKYITKVTVQNKAGTTVYKYDKEQLAKVDIKAKQLAGSVVIIEYAIDVTNKGAVPGYAKAIVDYLSPELKFSSELNTSWYQGTDNNLYCVELADELIKPGETKQVKLVLTKTMTESNTGLVNNTAEIYDDFNEYALKDTNSTPANKAEKENDMSGADIIITVATGSPAMYIGIVIASALILGAGIYLINKKVIQGKID